MPTVISHGIVGLAAGNLFPVKNLPKRFWFFTLILPILPDADVIGFRFGIHYGDFFGHRGFFHSLFFALITALFVVSIFFQDGRRPQPKKALRAISRRTYRCAEASHNFISPLERGARPLIKEWEFTLFFFLLTASHGVLDAFTDGGLGIALFSPFDNSRIFFPWQPIRVAPIGIHAFFSPWGLRVILSEILWVWLPAFSLVFFTKVPHLLARNSKQKR